MLKNSKQTINASCQQLLDDCVNKKTLTALQRRFIIQWLSPNNSNAEKQFFRALIFLVLFFRLQKLEISLPNNNDIFLNELSLLLGKKNTSELINFFLKKYNVELSLENQLEEEKEYWGEQLEQNKAIVIYKNNFFIHRKAFEYKFCMEFIDTKIQQNKLNLISGGPGTGKTTRIIDIIKNLNPKEIAILAPTGKAISRITEKITNITLQTIHLFLKYRNKKFIHNNKNKVTQYKYIFVDESSMVSLSLFNALFKAIPNDTLIYLIGDNQQLGAIDDYSPFNDIIEKVQEQAPNNFVLLTKNYRSQIPNTQEIFAQCSNKNIFDKNLWQEFNGFNNNSSYTFISSQKFKIQDVLEQYYENYVSKNIKSKEFFKQYKILTITNKLSLGTEKVNSFLKAQIQQQLSQKSLNYMPVMVTKNNYQLNAFNGNCGYYKNKTIILENNSQAIPENIVEFELNFALNIHKSQGSEYDYILIIIDNHELISKKLFYTAISRAKKACYLYADEHQFN